MVCTLCINNASEGCGFDFDKAFLEIKNHYISYKIALKEKVKENKELLYNNERLRKAVDKLNDQINSQTIQQSLEGKRIRLDERNSDEITVIDDENNQFGFQSVFDTALNATALNETTSEVISETEFQRPQKKVRRRSMLDTKINPSYTKNTLQLCKNDENRRPATNKSAPKFDIKTNDWHENKQTPSTHKTNQSEMIDTNSKKLFKQSRLNFHKPEAKQTSGLTIGLSKITSKNQTDNDDEFDFDRTATFCLNISNAEKTNTSNEVTIFSPENKVSDPSILAITVPNPPVICIDESREEQESECSDDDFVATNQVLKGNQTKSTASDKAKSTFKKPIDSKNVLDDNNPMCSETPDLLFKIEPITPPKRHAQQASLTHSKASSSKHKNPIFMETESSEEMDEDFPQPINMKLENRQVICTKCNNHEQCVCKHFENDDEFMETPDGFWNPHLDSFPEGDPRNETLVDTRFVGIKRGNIDAIKKL